MQRFFFALYHPVHFQQRCYLVKTVVSIPAGVVVVISGVAPDLSGVALLQGNIDQKMRNTNHKFKEQANTKHLHKNKEKPNATHTNTNAPGSMVQNHNRSQSPNQPQWFGG